ncbi:MAG: hypothetical protein JW993_17460 [Sedimentisphaerales bacterium]|nr:hypothetical protein [Sedimentisphaerales bacterium]
MAIAVGNSSASEDEPEAESTPNDWQTTTYTYDPAGRRIAKAIDGEVAIRYVYDGVHCIAEYDANDTLLRTFLYGPGVDQPICMVEASGTYAGTFYYHFDGLGSVVALSDADGDTVQTYEYSVYGQPAAACPEPAERDGAHCIAAAACPELAEWDANDTLLRKFLYGPGVDQLHSLRSGQANRMIEASGTYTGTYYYHFDGLGSVVALSDADGDTVQTYE